MLSRWAMHRQAMYTYGHLLTHKWVHGASLPPRRHMIVFRSTPSHRCLAQAWPGSSDLSPTSTVQSDYLCRGCVCVALRAHMSDQQVATLRGRQLVFKSESKALGRQCRLAQSTVRGGGPMRRRRTRCPQTLMAVYAVLALTAQDQEAARSLWAA